ncbi:LOW QUALITY PROTEIN: dendritic cell-specific transmembrane protein-like [Chiloscyllium plagiosum]|uniref:LOW QUALITY PROTEIN: dendritic cell-specific transmembrane protein-like n=1 Tax=Chiloscyllium plagiosum TaxID=36176 RepID=UPI001CB82465|nr:LOW QUALITY PROTEIN: dendritic cell-specific transmembrane protein-like [Chiloscyllium plagiosum]
MPLLRIIKQQSEILWNLFVSEGKAGLKNIVCLISFCLLMGLGASGILYISLQALYCSLKVSLTVRGIFTAIIPGALFLSKHLRCFILIILISCGTQQGRNALIMAGTCVVLFNCAQNSFHNLKGLSQCIICYLNHTVSSINDLLQRYIDVIRWLPNFLSQKSEVIIISIDVKDRIDEELQAYLDETRHHLENLSRSIILTFDRVLMVSKSIMVAFGLLLVLLASGLYIRKYVRNTDFENVFITKQFVELDERRSKQGKAALLPLTKKERKHLIKIPSLKLMEKERKNTLKFFTPILANLLFWGMNIDYGLYLLISSIRIHFVSLPTMDLNLFSKASISYKAPLFPSDCFPEPTLTINDMWIPLTTITSALVLLTLLAAKIATLKILILSSFYPEAQRDRAYFLHEEIIKKRSSERLKLKTKKSLNGVVNSVSFWFPIFKMKQKIEETENNPEEEWNTPLKQVHKSD